MHCNAHCRFAKAIALLLSHARTLADKLSQCAQARSALIIRDEILIEEE
jgi:hypothetical protein